MKSFYASLITILLSLPGFAQEFSKSYLSPATTAHYIDGYDILADDDGIQAVILASDQNTNGEINPFYIDYVKTQSNGELEMLIKYSHGDITQSLYPSQIIRLPNNTILISGTHAPVEGAVLNKPIFINIDSDGNVLWSKSINRQSGAAYNSRMTLLGNGEVLFLYKDVELENALVFCKIDQEGNISDFFRYSEAFDYPQDIIAHDDGTFDLLSVNGNFLKVSNDLTTIHSNRKYYAEGGINCNKLNNGDYLFASSQILFGHPTVFRTNADGSVLWAKNIETYYGTSTNGFQTISFDFIKQDDEGRINIGIREVNTNKLMLLILDSNGEVEMNGATSTNNNRTSHYNNNDYSLLSLAPFPSSDFILEKRELSTIYPCEIESTHNAIEGDAMELTSLDIEFTSLAPFPTIDITVSRVVSTELIEVEQFCQTVSVSDISNPSIAITVYPNPTQGRLEIDSPEKIDEIRVYNYLGDIVLKSNQTPLFLEGLQSGMYIVEVSISGHNIRKKVIVD